MTGGDSAAARGCGATTTTTTQDVQGRRKGQRAESSVAVVNRLDCQNVKRQLSTPRQVLVETDRQGKQVFSAGSKDTGGDQGSRAETRTRERKGRVNKDGRDGREMRGWRR